MKLISNGRSSVGAALGGLIWVLAAALTATAAGQATKAKGGGQASEPITLESVRAVLGTANELASGVIDLTKSPEEVIIAYRFYDPDMENYEMDFANELAPKIQALYRKFPGLNRIQLQVTANDASGLSSWKPFVELALDRKTVEEIHWTGFLVRYLLDETLRFRK